MRIARIAALTTLAAIVIGSGSISASAAPAPIAEGHYSVLGLMYNIDTRSKASVDPIDVSSLTNYVSAREPVHYVTTSGGGVSFDSMNQTLSFDGSESASYQISPGFEDFRRGISIEARVSFGTSVNPWERVIDLGNGEGWDNIIVSRVADSRRIMFELWSGFWRVGRAETGNVIPTNGKLISIAATIGADRKPHIYVDGRECRTTVSWSASAPRFDALPSVANRASNFIGQSNWILDSRLEGAVQYVRVYNRALASAQVAVDAAVDKAYRVTSLPILR